MGIDKKSELLNLEEESKKYRDRVNWTEEPVGPTERDLGADLNVLLKLEPGSEEEIESEVGHLEEMVTNGFENVLANDGIRMHYERVLGSLAVLLDKLEMLTEVDAPEAGKKVQVMTLEALNKVAEMCQVEPIGGALKGQKSFSFRHIDFPTALDKDLPETPDETLHHDFLALSKLLERLLRSGFPFHLSEDDYVKGGYYGEKKDYIGALDQFLESAESTKRELEAGIATLRERIKLLDECSELAKKTRAKHLKELEEFK